MTGYCSFSQSLRSRRLRGQEMVLPSSRQRQVVGRFDLHEAYSAFDLPAAVVSGDGQIATVIVLYPLGSVAEQKHLPFQMIHRQIGDDVLTGAGLSGNLLHQDNGSSSKAIVRHYP